MFFGVNYFKNWCIDKIIKIIVVFVFLMFVLFIIFVAGISTNFQAVSTQIMYKSINVSTTVLSNKKIEWGIKRESNHGQPNLGENNKKIIEDFNGYTIGNNRKPYIYLTFDVGYDGGYTEHILDVLKENNVKATFFITGQFAKTSIECVKRMIKEGHIIGNHTVNHKIIPDCTNDVIKEEIMNLHQKVFKECNYEMKYFRPPEGVYSEKTIAYIETLGYKTVMWSFAYDDWDNNKQGREEYAKKKILDNMHNGEIMLLHATSKDNNNVLDYIVKEIKKQGYEFKSIEEFER